MRSFHDSDDRRSDVKICGCTDNEFDSNETINEIYERTRTDVDGIIRLLLTIISHCETENNVNQICNLLTSYIQEIGEEGYRLKHLSAVTQILEFLTWRVKEIPAYRYQLDQMLALCDRPPLLEKPSDCLVSFNIMEEYFSSLGYILVILPTKREFLILQAALNRLLVRKKPVNKAALKLQFCIWAMETSRLPITVAELLDASLPDMYPIILEFVNLLASISDICCYKMVEAGILNTLLLRMDLAYATQTWCSPPPDVPLSGEEYSEDTMVLIMEILWCLLTSILPSNYLPTNLGQLHAPVQCATWGLRYAFKRHIFMSKGSKTSIKLRNSMAMLILVGLVALPNWNLVGSGLAEDIIFYLTIAETGKIKIWTEDVKFYYSNEDLFFMKILLMITSYLVDVDGCIYIMLKENVLNTVLELVDPDIRTFRPSRRSTQYWDLSGYAWYTLSRLVPKMPNQFIKNDGAGRLIMILDCSMKLGIDTDFMVNWTKTVCTIVTEPELLKNFRDNKILLIVILLVNKLLESEICSLQYQRLLTLALIVMEKLINGQASEREIYGQEIIKIVIRIINKCLYQDNCCDVEMDQRLLIALGALIWECIVWYTESLINFLDIGGMFMLLDILEIGMFHVQCLFLGIILDICDNIYCGPYLWTWRGTDKSKGLISLLGKIWREEEIRLGIKRNAEGAAEDAEVPQMGTKQWHATYFEKLDHRNSPGLDALAGSVRPKIYALRQLIEREKERNEITKYRYKILLDDIPLEDRITISSVDLYFRLKRGEMWTEVLKYFERVGVTPLGMDGQVTFLMMQRHHLWGMFLKERHEKLISEEREKEIVEEKEALASIRNSKLAPTLDALWEINYIRRTTDHWHRIEKKCEQRIQVNASLNFPYDADEDHCRRTFQDNINVTAVFGQHYTMRMENKPRDQDFIKMKLSPVSAESSEFNLKDETCIVPLISAVSVSHPCSGKSLDKTKRCVRKKRILEVETNHSKN